uniref:otoferlin-like isoform X2 n=1 Tax=Myxine glutinosa TaxID=7769 RepID=UPI0035900243
MRSVPKDIQANPLHSGLVDIGDGGQVGSNDFGGCTYCMTLSSSFFSWAVMLLNKTVIEKTFRWPLASPVFESEKLEVKVYNHNMVFGKRLVGTFCMVLQKLVEDGMLEVTDTLLDTNNTCLLTTITLGLRYQALDGSAGIWNEREFLDVENTAEDDLSLISHDEEESGVRRRLMKIGNKLKARKGTGSQISLATNYEDDDEYDDMYMDLDKQAMLLAYGQDGDTESLASVTAITTNVSNRRSKPQTRTGSIGGRIQDYQISINLIEARQLLGVNIDPEVVIEVGEEKKHSSQKQSTNCPYYNEYFVFDFHVSPNVLFDQLIKLSVVHSKNIIRSKTMIGSFKMDVGFVYSQPDHRFYHKWAILTDPSDINSPIKGYLKCDISILGKGDSVKIVHKTDEDDEADIESNLLLPAGVSPVRQWAQFHIRIYRAEGLPKMNTAIMANVKKAFMGRERDLVDPFVEVNFAGQKARTSVEQNNYEPEWNEEITITELFPPLCNCIKVQIRDSDNVNNVPIGTHKIDLRNISNEGDKGFLPSFGPTWVNIYGSTRNYTLIQEHQELNDGIGEGVAFRARLLMSITVDMVDPDDSDCPNYTEPTVESIPPLPPALTGRSEEFLLFATFMEATMIDRRVSDKPISFEVSIGNFGNALDGMNKSEQHSDEEDDDELDDDDDKKLLLQRSTITSDSGEELQLSMTNPKRPDTKDRQYYHLEFHEEKPCVSVRSFWTDQRRRLFLSNIIDKIADSLDDGINDVLEALQMDKQFPERRLRGVLEELSAGCSRFLSAVSKEVGQAGRTRLDREKLKSNIQTMELIRQESQALRKQVKKKNIPERLKQAKDFLEKLFLMSFEPQNSIPDVFVWMISNGNKRVAYTRIPAKDILYSLVDEEIGKDCGKIKTLFLKLPGKKTQGSSGWHMQAKLEVYFWFGLYKQRREMLKRMTSGYTENRMNDTVEFPMNLCFNSLRTFQLRAHIYQARNLFAADNNGLSDPYAQVIFSTHCKTTEVIKETLCPTWDQMLVFDDIRLYGDEHEMREDPPLVIIEIFDQDTLNKAEYIGRAVARPLVMINEAYLPPKFPPSLDYYPIFRGMCPAGEMLAAFELLQIPPEGPEKLPPMTSASMTSLGPFVAVPKTIRPTLVKYRIEVLFWGLRDLKRIHLSSVEMPRVDIECAGKGVQSATIINFKKNPNFSVLMKFFEVDLPEDEIFHPPLNIRVVDSRSFGRNTLVGSHAVSCLKKFIFRPQDRMKSKILTAPVGLNDHMDGGNVKESEPNRNKEETIIDIDQPDTGDTKKPRKKKKKTKKIADDEDDKSALDWWSKYFASYELLKAQRKEDAIMKADQEQGAELVSGNKKDKKKPDLDIERLKKHMNPNRLKDCLMVLRTGGLTMIYDNELEEEFNNFEDWLCTFSLYRGKSGDDDSTPDEDRIVGRFKGSMCVYKWPISEEIKKEVNFDANMGMFQGIPNNDITNVLVRVYIIRALDLHPADMNGKADPYIALSLGNTEIRDNENYIPKQLNPMFGKSFDMEVILPMESLLTVAIYDWDLVGSDDLIGETKIDLENRFYTKHRSTCGVAQNYDTQGYNTWRDPMKPSQILTKLCRDYKLDGPHFGPGRRVKVANRVFSIPLQDDDDEEEDNDFDKDLNEHLSLKVIKQWDEIPAVGCKLVPEHVETRPLYKAEKPGIEQGRIEMWVDIFPKDMPSPGPPVDISPRKPKGYTLRVIIWNTSEVTLSDVNFITGEASSDIYVRGWLQGPQVDKQDTDVHYSSLTGEGNFNWRFVFPFDYLLAEEKIIVSKKESLFSWDETEYKIPARLTLQVWDADHFSSDDFLGSIELDLNRFARGAKSAKQCSLKIVKMDGSVPLNSIFKLKRIKGWWPLTFRDENDEEKLAGKVEAEMHLLTSDEAEKSPVGQARNEPEPLEKPNRPNSSINWFLNPMKSLALVIWRNYKWYIFGAIFIIILAVFIVLLMYTLPGAISNNLIVG